MKTILNRVALCLSVTLTITSLSLTSCDNAAGRSGIYGSLKGAEGHTVYMEALPLASQPLITDSVNVAPDGTFSLLGQLQSEPTFYNIRLDDGRTFTVILDSAQVVRLSADTNNKQLVGNISFTNSPANDALQSVMSGASALLAKYNDKSLTTDDVSDFKQQMTTQVFSDPRSMVGYYIVFQKIGGHPLFDVMDKADHRLYSAVATSLQMAYPNSKQVKYLCDYVLGARAAQKATARRDSLLQQAVELNSPDLRLPDKDGNEIALTSLRGKTVLLFFWTAADENARKAFTQLASTYKKFRNRGLEIYAVSFDTSKILWEAASNNTEWVNVCDLKGAASPAVATYQVATLPSNYILDPKGNLIGKDLFNTRLDNKLNEILH